MYIAVSDIEGTLQNYIAGHEIPQLPGDMEGAKCTVDSFIRGACSYYLFIV